MSEPQLAKYLDYREIEIKEAMSSFSKPSMSEGFGDKNSGKISSYRIRSRMASNYLIPFYALKTVKDENRIKPIIEKKIHEITKEDLLNLDKFSPKFERIIKNINSHPSQLSVIYSEFVTTGINLMSLVLEAKGFIYWHKKPNKTNLDEFDLDLSKNAKDKKGGAPKPKNQTTFVRTYAIISGDVPFIERTRIIKVFNSKANITGEIISVLLISKSGAEGITLKNVRDIHVMEPFWNWSRVEQVIARVSRMGSHLDLPEKDRTIQPYIYISVYPSHYKPAIEIEERSTDEELLFNALANKKINEQFELAMIESSIDCSINKKKLNISDDRLICHLCVPDNKTLYTTDINQDIKVNNCKPLVSEEIETKKITIDGNAYHYTQDGNTIKIFEYDNSIGKYIEMKRSNPLYSDITKKILKF